MAILKKGSPFVTIGKSEDPGTSRGGRGRLVTLSVDSAPPVPALASWRGRGAARVGVRIFPLDGCRGTSARAVVSGEGSSVLREAERAVGRGRARGGAGASRLGAGRADEESARSRGRPRRPYDPGR